MSRRSTGWPTPPEPDEASRSERLTAPPPPDDDSDAPPPSRRATEPPVPDYASLRESCSSFEVGKEASAPRAAHAHAPPLVPTLASEGLFLFAAVLTGDDLDWFPLSDAARRIVGALDGKRSLLDVAAHLDIEGEEVCGIARDLLARGIISLRGVG